ncbi:hypothetical protein PsB1_2008 [Candidatus Phycosocius spiralis]|uniref:Pesticin C-terminal domain-containing protein n=1 Tax=Candidatus Phycosocius spiralis TaxID=2815099 RepID=A0ABQ4PYW0_9PROT|nr:hypothetical protein PsB1_2008 [Candidatus Phycosocius spiralis]
MAEANGLSGTSALIEGTDFGDNIRASLPSAIGSAIGGYLAEGGGSGPGLLEAIGEKLKGGPTFIPEQESVWQYEVDARNTLYKPVAANGNLVLAKNETQRKILALKNYLTPSENDKINSLYLAEQKTNGDSAALEVVLARATAILNSRAAQPELLSEIEIDWNLIRKWEGFELKVYYVKDNSNRAFPNSGVTIGTGFDLGRRTSDELLAMGIDGGLVTKLTPYLGKRGNAARDIVEQRPLTLSQREVSTLDALMRAKKAISVAETYNKVSKDYRFQDLASGFQTAIASVHFQYGSIRATPMFMKQVTNQQWGAAIKNLRNFGDVFKSRRVDEADLMQNTLTQIDRAAGIRIGKRG